MITIENEGNDIYLFGRNENGETYLKKDDSFKPYFYAENSQGSYNTIDNKKAIKIVCKYPGEVKELRINYENTYEADFIYVNRYIVDKIQELSKEPLKICYLDIEIFKTKNGYESAELANNPINCVGCYDSFSKEHKQFYIKENYNELNLLGDFIQYIKNSDPDIIIAWNGNGFDFPFLINRIQKLGLPIQNLCRLNKNIYENRKKYSSKDNTKIFGRILIDLLVAYKKHFSAGGRESWSLDYISKYELKDLGGKEKYQGDLDNLFKNDINKFLSYNKRDVELLILLNEKLGIIEFLDEVRRLCFCRFEDVFFTTKMGDTLCFKYAKDKFILPTTKESNYEKFQGAFTHESEAKLHKNIFVMDMVSLYPSIMIAFNTSPETYLEKFEEGCINIDNKYFYKKESGMIPTIAKEMIKKRKETKILMKQAYEKYGDSSIEYKSLYTKQYALKVIVNGFYGLLGFSKYRLYKKEIAESITYIARKIINEVIKWFEEKGFKAIYADTDSIFAEMGDKSIENMIKLNNEINIYFKQYFKQFDIPEENNIFKLDFEKVFKTLFFKLKADGFGAKKKYAGKLIWKDGNIIDKLYIAGFESKRSDTPEIGRKFVETILRMICEENTKEQIDKYIEEFKNKILTEYTPEQIALPISITKELDKYHNEIHAKAARLANKEHNEGIKQGDKIKYIYIKNNENNAIAFKENMPPGYEIDYDLMIKRLIDLKIYLLYKSLGWEYEFKVKKKEKVNNKNSIKVHQVSLWG